MAKKPSEVKVKIVKVERDPVELRTRVIIYLSQNGSNPVEEMRTLERYNKPHEEIKRDHWAAILKQAGLPPETNGTWDVNAGCEMCPCSPGFETDYFDNFEVWVTYEYVNEQGQTMSRLSTRKCGMCCGDRG